MRSLVRQAGLQERIEVDSAGTGAWHVGSAPDARATAAARSRGTVLEGQARQVTAEDFDFFDLVIAMDSENKRALRALAGGDAERAKVRMLREFDPASADTGDLDVPDPYYGGEGGFEHVYDLVHAACEGLLEGIQSGRLP
ncbi:MAG: low molecular weight protein-tyrosine-phosphatase [Solirubrobacteraceae bacterium]